MMWVDWKSIPEMNLEQWKNQNKMEFLFISDIIKEDEKDEGDSDE